MSDEVNDDKDRLISLPEAAEIYGFNRQYLSQLARRGRLQAFKFGRMWATTPAHIETFIQSRKKTGVYRDDISID